MTPVSEAVERVRAHQNVVDLEPHLARRAALSAGRKMNGWVSDLIRRAAQDPRGSK